MENLIWQYGADDGLGIGNENLHQFYQLFKNKRYAMFIYLGEVETVDPFEIDKRGFGAMSAWITVNNIEEIIRKL